MTDDPTCTENGESKRTAPGIQMGKYGYRLAIVKPHKAPIYSRGRNVFSYGTVSFAAICDSPKVRSDGCGPGTTQVGSTVFSYAGVFGDFANKTYPTYYEPLSVPRTTCRSVALRWSEYGGSGPTYVQIVQSATDPQAASAAPDVVGTMDAHLDGGPWILDVASDGSVDIAVNGTFNCYTSTGF